MSTESNKGGRMTTFWGRSDVSYDDAIKAAVKTAREDLGGKSLDWLEVIEFRGGFPDGKLQYQVAVRIGYSKES